MLKRIVAFLLTMIMVAGLGTVSFATDRAVTTIPEGKAVNEVVSDVTSEKSTADVITRAADWDYKWTFIDSDKETKVPIGWAGGQLADGTEFGSDGGFYWQDGGDTVDVSVSVAYGVFSVSVSLGSVGGSGKYIAAPVGKACKLFIYKDIEISKYAVYKKHYGTSEEWTFDRYEYEKVATKEYLEVRVL